MCIRDRQYSSRLRSGARRGGGSLMKIGRIPYINCYPVYGAIDRGIVRLDAELVDGVPTDLNRRMAAGELDMSVVSAAEHARDPTATCCCLTSQFPATVLS